MTLPRLSLCTAMVLAALASLNAQSVTTAPVGAVTIPVNANSDQRVGITLQRPVLYAAAASAISTSTISVSGAIPTLDSSVKYVRFLDGALAGQWFTITSIASSSIQVAENLQVLGAAVGNKIEVRSFWTLGSLLPNGGGLPVSVDPFNPSALFLANDPQAQGTNLAASAAYFYHDGSLLPAGWYADGSLNASDNIVLSPEVSVTFRNATGNIAQILNVGNVPTTVTANTVVRRVAGEQDNLIYNPYPAPLVLSSSGLTANGVVQPSSDPFNPSELVLIYSSSANGLNAAASAAYFYHDGSLLPAGWYVNGSLDAADSISIAAGAAIVVRKASGSASEAQWKPALPYTL